MSNEFGKISTEDDSTKDNSDRNSCDTLFVNEEDARLLRKIRKRV